MTLKLYESIGYWYLKFERLHRMLNLIFAFESCETGNRECYERKSQADIWVFLFFFIFSFFAYWFDHASHMSVVCFGFSFGFSWKPDCNSVPPLVKHTLSSVGVFRRLELQCTCLNKCCKLNNWDIISITWWAKRLECHNHHHYYFPIMYNRTWPDLNSNQRSFCFPARFFFTLIGVLLPRSQLIAPRSIDRQSTMNEF